MSQPQLAADHRPLRGKLVLGIVAAATLVACAQPPRPADASPDHWSGRLAVQVEDDAGQSFSAGFELKGHPSAGELTLINPLGNIIARVEWTPHRAVLVQGQERREAASLQTLVHDLTGSDLPIYALFSWLKGEALQVAGWRTNLDALQQGRLSATREQPLPRTTLRIVLSL